MTNATVPFKSSILNGLSAERLKQMRSTKAYGRMITALQNIAPQTAFKATVCASEIYTILEQYRAFGCTTTSYQSRRIFELALYDYCIKRHFFKKVN